MIHDRDILAVAGGFCQQKYGAFTHRLSTAQRGEGSALTVTRSTVGRVHTRQGLVLPVAANEPRMHWMDLDADGVMETAVLLIEPQRTNDLLQSADISTTWTNVRSSESTDAVASPDGTTTADELIEDATASNTHYIIQNMTGLTADASYAFSIYARANTRDWIRLVVWETAAGGNHFAQHFDLTNGVVGTDTEAGTGAYLRSGIERVTVGGADWFRCTVVGTVGNGATAISAVVQMATGDLGSSYSGDGSSSVYVWGGQFEDAADWSSSYIPTTTAAATRNADVISLPYYGPLVDVTLFARFIELGNIYGASGTFGRVLQVGSSPHILLEANNSNDYEVVNVTGSTVTSPVTTPNPVALQTVELLGAVASTGTVQLDQAIDGGAITSGSPSSAPSSLQAKDTSTLYLGNVAGSSVAPIGLIAGGVLRGTGYTIADLRDFLAA